MRVNKPGEGQYTYAKEKAEIRLEKNAGRYGFKGLIDEICEDGTTIYKETWHWDYVGYVVK